MIRDSIVMQDTTIGKGCTIERSIIAEEVQIGDHVIMGVGPEVPNKMKPDVYSFGLVTVGDRSTIPSGVRIGKNTAISGLTVPEDYANGALESGESLIKAGEEA